MSDFETTGAAEQNRKDQARQLMDQAGQTLKQEAQSFASAAQDRVRAEAQKGKQTATKTLDDFANAIRSAGDRLAETDQSPASRLVRQAADGLESLSRNLADKEPEDLLNVVRDFGRRNPAAFIGGAVLVGLALGRLVRASETRPSIHPLSQEPLDFEADEEAYVASTGATGIGLDRPLSDNLSGLGSSTYGSSTSPADVETDEAGTTPPRTGGV